jgi:cytochrome bd-type quinol oxidase subunit 1
MNPERVKGILAFPPLTASCNWVQDTVNREPWTLYPNFGPHTQTSAIHQSENRYLWLLRISVWQDWSQAVSRSAMCRLT